MAYSQVPRILAELRELEEERDYLVQRIEESEAEAETNAEELFQTRDLACLALFFPLRNREMPLHFKLYFLSEFFPAANARELTPVFRALILDAIHWSSSR